jgi:hypothetical protein
MAAPGLRARVMAPWQLAPHFVHPAFTIIIDHAEANGVFVLLHGRKTLTARRAIYLNPSCGGRRQKEAPPTKRG